MSMVKECLRQMPGYLGLASRLKLCEFDEQEEQELAEIFWSAENDWKKKQVNVRRKIQEFKEEVSQEFQIDCRKRYLDLLKDDFQKLHEGYVGCYQNNDDFGRLVYKDLAGEQLNKIKKLQLEISYTGRSKNGITGEMLERARNYPIDNLVEINSQGFAKCLFHNDTHPSMYCRKNFYYCFSCGASGSVIDLYMHLRNCDFKEAVKNMG